MMERDQGGSQEQDAARHLPPVPNGAISQLTKMETTLRTKGSTDDHDEWFFPRNAATSPPQLMLLALFADYWLGRQELLPSAALVELLGGFDVSESSSRVALSRLTTRGFLVREYSGRNTSYNLSPKANRFISNRTREILNPDDPPPWDGTWTWVAYSIPEEHAHLRPKLRLRLKVHGFACLFDGLWVSALPAPPALAPMLVRLLPDQTYVVFRGQRLDINGDLDPATAYDLDSVRIEYQSFIDHAKEVQEGIVAGRHSPAEALVQRTRLLNSYRGLNREVMSLPTEVLGETWPEREARQLFVEVYNALRPLAEMQFKMVLARHDAELAETVTSYTTNTFELPRLITPG